MFPAFCGTRCREKKAESIQELFPTHPTYQNPIFINPGPLLVRFLDFSVLHFLLSFFSLLDPIGAHWRTSERYMNPWRSTRPLLDSAKAVPSLPALALAAVRQDPRRHTPKRAPIGPLWGLYRGSIGRKTEKLDFRHFFLLHMAIQAVLA